MVFVLEIIPEEEKEKLNYKSEISYRVIDRDRGYLFLCTGKAPAEVYRKFDLHIGENIVHISSEKREHQRERDPIDNKIKHDAFHKVTEIKIPRALHMDPEDIKKIITEALAVYGVGSLKYNGSSEVTFPFNCKILFTEENKTRAENR